MNEWINGLYFDFIISFKLQKQSVNARTITIALKEENEIYLAFRKLPATTPLVSNNNQHARLQFYLHIFRCR